MQLIKILISVW